MSNKRLKKMTRTKQEISMSTQVSVRLEPQDYLDFKKVCHLEYSQMATVARGIILDWLEKHKKKLK